MPALQNIDITTFINDYWQKKPLLIKQALPNFISPLQPDELAGLSLEDDIESRIVIHDLVTGYKLMRGSFSEETYLNLPEKNWTLLVQGVDKLIPSVNKILNYFDFIPQWRLDDIMVSYATTGGNVGPHFDYYDVFLLQGKGKRQWHLTADNCTDDNYIPNSDLRIMQAFNTEESYICEAGDILYIPPKWGHHGISLSDDCLTYSIGYRAYKEQELWDSYMDNLSKDLSNTIYKDPNWNNLKNTSEITAESIQQAYKILQETLNRQKSEDKHWFGCLVTKLDNSALLSEILNDIEKPTTEEFLTILKSEKYFMRDSVSRFAFLEEDKKEYKTIYLYINGDTFPANGASLECIKFLVNKRIYPSEQLIKFFNQEENKKIILDFWQNEFICFCTPP